MALILGVAAACGGAADVETADFELDVATVVETGGQDPTIAAVGNPTVLLAWGEVGTSGEEADDRGYVRAETGGGVFVARSEDQGRTFDDPIRIDVDDPAADEGFSTSTRNDRPPRLFTTADGNVHVVWQVTAEPAEGERWPRSDMRIATSEDGGQTFGSPRPLVDQTLSPGFYGVHAAANGNIHIGFLSDSGVEDAIGSAVRVATSTDGGGTFTVTDEFTTGDVCQCCPVSFAEDSTGRMAMGWRHIYPLSDEEMFRDHVVSFSDDAGATWSDWSKIHNDEWLLPQCPHSGSALNFDSEDRLHAVWYTGKEDGPGVYYARADEGDADFGAPRALLSDDFFPIVQPDAVITGDDTIWATFGDEREEEPAVWLARIDPDGSVTVSDEPVAQGRYPRLTLSGDDVVLTYEYEGSVDVAVVSQ